MNFDVKYRAFLEKGISKIEIISYAISFIVISISILKSITIYIVYYNKPQILFDKIKLTLSESSELALSFILSVEILKLFFINTYKQLVIILTLVVIKIIISYFLETEIGGIRNENKYK